MAKDKLKSKRGKLAERKAGNRDPKPNTYLIVTEGEKTEPYYFDGLKNYINGRYGNSIDAEKPIIETSGEGRSTSQLVLETSRIVKKSKRFYRHVWVIFDRDNNSDFDDAIQMAIQNGYKVGWSNQSFEYWIFLLFNFSDADLLQGEWTAKINELFKRQGIDPNGYQKSDPRIFEIATQKGSLKAAVQYARKIEARYSDRTPPSKCAPCTTVHHLIEELSPYLSELLK